MAKSGSSIHQVKGGVDSWVRYLAWCAVLLLSQRSTPRAARPLSQYFHALALLMGVLLFPLPLLAQTELITNGSFAADSSGWTRSGNFYADHQFTDCHVCPGYAYVSNLDGSSGNNLFGTMYQTFTVPAGSTSASLSFWYKITTAETGGVPNDVLNVTLQNSSGGFLATIAVLSNLHQSSSYSQATFNLSPYIGQTVRLHFFGTTNGSAASRFRVDTVSATAVSPPPNPPSNLSVIGSSNILLMGWNDGSSNESGFKVEWRTGLSGSYTFLGQVGSNVTAYQDPSTRTFGNIYCYRVYAFNASGNSGYSNEDCGTALASPVLTSPADGASVSGSSVTLQWSSVAQAGIYAIDLGSSCGSTTVLNDFSTANTSTVVSNLAAGTYYWRARAANNTHSGISAESGCRSFTVAAPDIRISPLSLAFDFSSLVSNIAAADHVLEPGRSGTTLAPRVLPPKPLRTLLRPFDSSRRVILKFAEGTGVRLHNGSFAGRVSLQSVQSVLERYGIDSTQISRLFTRPEAELDDERVVGEYRSGLQLADLNLYYVLQLLPDTSAAALCDDLNAIPSVELAQPAPEPAPPPVDIPPTTPLFENMQGYRGSPPAGIGVRDVSQVPGANGSGTKIVDVEFSWVLNHEDLELPGSTNIDSGSTIDPPTSELAGNHGTAVLGVLVGRNNSYGVTGIAAQSQAFVAPTQTIQHSYNLPRAINLAAGVLNAGDVILIEQQMLVCGLSGCTFSNSNGCGPMEYQQTVFDAIQIATANGIVVVEAAGNGTVDLDSPGCGGLFNRAVRDSGAIIVGAGDSSTHARLSFSSYGSRVDLQGWGGNVTTTGYGSISGFDPGGDSRQFYRADFNGTSSASPIVAGAVLAIQGARLAAGQQRLTPGAIRTLLSDTGTSQATEQQHIGPLPNLPAALQSLGLYCPASGCSGHAFTIFNDGNATLSITSIQLQTAASWIQWSPQAPFSIAPGGSREVTVTVNSASAPAGSSTRRLLVSSNDPDESPYPGGVDIIVNRPSNPTTCTSFSINPTGVNPSSASGSQAVTITGSPSGCQGGSWSASGNGSWLTVSPTSGTGSGSVTVFWTQNTSTSSRSASATIAGNSFNVNQAGSTSPTCTSFSINPTGSNPNASSGSQAVTITGSPSGCQGGNWSASGNGSWLTVSPTSGTGSGSATVFWTQNTSPSSRSASATIAGNSFNVNQQAPSGVQAAVSPADFDGDGISDWVVYRNGTWVYFGPCGHLLNATGPALDPACSPCAEEICGVDSYCCDTQWDSICVDEFNQLCR